jgi:tRNA pseudouridine38-40 synthase
MRNIKLTISYDGTRYSGWQSQKNGRSIQDTIERAIKKVTGKTTSLKGSGRTDAGVHAAAQVANFHTSSKLPAKNIMMAINKSLPKDIVITKAEEVHSRFNSQHSARYKIYRYTVFNGDFLDPLIRHFAAKCFYSLNIGRMKKAAKMLEGRHDFRSFQAKDAIEKGSVRTVSYIRVKKSGKRIYFEIKADGFLYNMVRNIVGTLIEVGRGRMEVADMKRILLGKDRRLAGPTMPAKGLCLMEVGY